MKVKSLIFIALLSAVFTLINYLIFQWYSEPVADALRQCVVSFVLNFLFFGSFSGGSGLLKTCVFVLLSLSVFLLYTCYTYQVSPLINSIRLLLQTDVKEMKELLTWSVFLPVLLLGFMGLVFSRLKLCALRWRFSFMMCLCFIVSLMGISFFKGQSQIGAHLSALEEVLSYLPFNFITDGLLELKREFKISKRHDLNGALFNLPSSKEDLLIILVIGESARFDRFHINGYSLNTSPLLEQVPNLISLKNYYALETYTVGAFPYLFKRSNDRQFVDAEETSFVSVLKQLGFKTYYLSLQTDIKSELYELVVEHDYYSLGNKMRHITHHKNFYDEDLLPAMQKIIQEKGNRLVVLHTMGSHSHYQDRVPAAFYSKKLSDYDNTIKYTDKVLAQVIEQAKTFNSLVIYSSDHGESLEGDKVRLHAYPYKHALADAPEQLHIPGFWYFSQKFLSDKKKQTLYQHFLENSQKRSDQSFIYHSLLGCIGVQSTIIQDDKNLCAKA